MLFNDFICLLKTISYLSIIILIKTILTKTMFYLLFITIIILTVINKIDLFIIILNDLIKRQSSRSIKYIKNKTIK